MSVVRELLFRKDLSLRMRPFFHWKYAGVFISFFWGAILATLGIAAGVEYSKLFFILAYIFSFAAMLWSLGCWITSDFLHDKNPIFWKRTRRKRIIKWDFISFKIWKYGFSGFILILFVMSWIFISWMDETKELSSLHGWLYPANKPVPPNSCGKLDKDYLMVFLGDFVGASKTFPLTVLEAKGKKRIVLDKREDGLLSVSMDVLGNDERIIARIEKGGFTININNYLKINRRDRSHLQVINQNGEQVLNMEYFNKQAIRITAVLRYPGMAPIIIREGEIIIGTNKLIGGCGKDPGQGNITILKID